MKRIQTIVAVAILAVVLWHTLHTPKIERITYSWGKINESTTEILVNIDVYNPNPFPIPLKDVIVNVYMNGIDMGKGHAIKVDISANSESTVVIVIYLDNRKIPEWWVSHIKNGEKTTMDIKGYLVFDLKVFDFKVPLEFSNLIRTDILSSLSSKPETVSIDGLAKMTIRSIESHWGNVNDRWTEIITVADIYNPNPYPIPVISFDYTIKMNGITVGDGSEDLNAVIPPKSEAKLTLITKIMNDKLKDWWITHIKNGERSTVVLEIRPKIKVAGKEISFVLTKQMFEIRTSFLG